MNVTSYKNTEHTEKQTNIYLGKEISWFLSIQLLQQTMVLIQIKNAETSVDTRVPLLL